MSKILLVDDDKFVVEYFKTHLEEWGYGIVEASDGMDILSQISFDRFSPSCILFTWCWRPIDSIPFSEDYGDWFALD